MKYPLTLLSIVVAIVGCKSPFTNNLPPAQQIMHPGPGVDGPGPGVMMLGEPGGVQPMPGARSQIIFAGPDGMIVTWEIGPGQFDVEPLICPGRFNFPQGAIYRLKLTNIPGREGVELYPTLEIGPALPRTEAYLAHNAIPMQFTEEDFDQVLSGNFVTKVIYLPDPEFQELALAGIDTLVSTRLDPGIDPIIEADRRGAILAIVRMGNKDLQVGGGEEVVGEDGVAGYGDAAVAAGYCGPDGGGLNGNGMALPPGLVAGATAPQYGMPISGTPIGLPGPPHLPLGIPAGLQKHTIHNHTNMRIPNPVEKIGVHVKQSPGMSYPKPPHKLYIHERIRTPLLKFRAPWRSKHQTVASPASDECTDCAP
ncbi:MAG TPA: hypothetical protein VMV69_09980 [Pirellulales bacterium]|nr:hypothetical protein [Pirellulales bacterium]